MITNLGMFTLFSLALDFTVYKETHRHKNIEFCVIMHILNYWKVERAEEVMTGEFTGNIGFGKYCIIFGI